MILVIFNISTGINEIFKNEKRPSFS